MKSCFIKAKVVVFGEGGCNRVKWLYSREVVVFGQSSCIRAEVVVLGLSGCFRAKVVVFRQSCYIWKMWLYSG